MHRIDESLSIAPTEVANSVSLILARKYHLYQRDNLMQGAAIAN